MHVSPGLPPIRSGGMPRYCADVINAQIELGHEVALLFPGRYKKGASRVECRVSGKLELFELINPLPVALSFGVSDPEEFIRPVKDDSIFYGLLNGFSPDVIHVHEIMGIHKEFFSVAKALGIPIVYTTHDYYPICLRCTFVNDEGSLCCKGPDGARCAQCNFSSGMTLKRSKVMQSGLFRLYKNMRFINMVVKSSLRFAKDFKGQLESNKKESLTDSVGEQYSAVLSYNREILSMCNLILANSPLSKRIYSNYIDPDAVRHVPITHSGLQSSFKRDRYGGKEVVFAYFGGSKKYKGFQLLLDAFELVQKELPYCRLELYGDGYPEISIKNTVVRRPIPAEKIQKILASMDVVVVPSLWPETFGFVVLEALAASRQVVCSDLVGAAYLVDPSLVFANGQIMDLAAKMKTAAALTKRDAGALVPAGYPLDIKAHADNLTDFYKLNVGEVTT